LLLLQLLLLLMQLALGLLRWLSLTALLLHSFSLGAHFICMCSAGRRRDLLTGF